MDNTGKTKAEKIADCEEFIMFYAIWNESENNLIDQLIWDFLLKAYELDEDTDLEEYADKCKNIVDLDLLITKLSKSERKVKLVNYLKTKLDNLLNEI